MSILSNVSYLYIGRTVLTLAMVSILASCPSRSSLQILPDSSVSRIKSAELSQESLEFVYTIDFLHKVAG